MPLGATRGAQTGGVRPRPLRGAASHEAEGRSGARGGGADRVGPPTGRRRLRLLRQIGDHHLGPIRIVWYLERYHGITIAEATVYRILRRHGLNLLPSRVGRRAALRVRLWSGIRRTY